MKNKEILSKSRYHDDKVGGMEGKLLQFNGIHDFRDEPL
jgi:hypothetical protein